MIYNKELADYLNTFRWSENRDEKPIGDEELNRILMIMVRVAKNYSCSTSEGFTQQEEELERILKEFYEAGIKDGKKAAKREIIWRIQESM